MARPAFKPTDEQRDRVRELASVGVPQDDICKVVRNENGKPINRRTLRKHFAAEIEEGNIHANAEVAGALFKKATGGGQGSVIAAIFWLKSRAGWKETQSVELSGPNGEPLQPPTINIGFSNGGPGEEPQKGNKP